jgi:hypothetical protein
MKTRALAVSLALTAALFPAQARGEEPPATVTPAPPSPPSASAPSSSSLLSTGHLPSLVTGGLAVVALGTGVVFGILAWQDHESFLSNPTTDTANRGESRGLTADMCFGGAATLAVASIVMYFTHEDTPAAPQATGRATAPAFAIAPFASPHGAGAGAVVRF